MFRNGWESYHYMFLFSLMQILYIVGLLIVNLLTYVHSQGMLIHHCPILCTTCASAQETGRQAGGSVVVLGGLDQRRPAEEGCRDYPFEAGQTSIQPAHFAAQASDFRCQFVGAREIICASCLSMRESISARSCWISRLVWRCSVRTRPANATPTVRILTISGVIFLLYQPSVFARQPDGSALRSAACKRFVTLRVSTERWQKNTD